MCAFFSFFLWLELPKPVGSFCIIIVHTQYYACKRIVYRVSRRVVCSRGNNSFRDVIFGIWFLEVVAVTLC